jgi:hypothetical protein
MEKTVKQKMMESLIAFGKMYQLPTPSADYLETLQAALHAYKWRLSEFNNALNQLLKDDKYADFARFGKYPTVHDFLRVRQKAGSKQFYDSLSAYLSGDWWEKDNVLALASPAQANAILQAGGLSNLFQRATGDMPTPVYKLVDMIAENESEAPTELIDTDHRIGAPTTLKQIGKEKPKGENK